MRKKFEYEFDDESSENAISFEYDDDIEEDMEVILEDGIPSIYANQQALISLAKTFIKMALSEYEDGFHIHLRKDFDADQPEAIRCFLRRSRYAENE
jgi:hypothetical protein